MNRTTTKTIQPILIIIVALCFPHNVWAGFKSDLDRCINISDNNDRLDCYDTVVKYYKLRVVTPSPAPEKANAPEIAAQTPTKPINSKPVLTADTPRTSAEDSFGQSDKTQIESIKTRITGEFTGWKKGMKLHLENGQVWKVVSRGAGYKKMNNPEITIKRGIFGSFDAKVEGLNARAKLRRIK